MIHPRLYTIAPTPLTIEFSWLIYDVWVLLYPAHVEMIASSTDWRNIIIHWLLNVKMLIKRQIELVVFTKLNPTDPIFVLTFFFCVRRWCLSKNIVFGTKKVCFTLQPSYFFSIEMWSYSTLICVASVNIWCIVFTLNIKLLKKCTVMVER